MSESSNRHLAAHLRSAEQILSHYTGEEPFPLYLRSFFRSNPKFGSRDRRVVSSLCYDSFRLGGSLSDVPLRERIIAGHFLCATDSPALIELERPEWLPYIGRPLDARLELLSSAYPRFEEHDIFPLVDELSGDIDRKAFIRSHFIQPDLFIRLRPKNAEKVRKAIADSDIPHRFIAELTVALPNGTDTSSFGVADKDFVVQDLSSQRTADFMPEPAQLPDRPKIWDACAGSGGKSILAHDRFGNARLLVTDARDGILANLKERFRTAGIRRYDVDRLDLTQMGTGRIESIPKGFDLVVADVPCSGSGTWSRNPWEMLHVDREVIGAYRSRQESIVERIMPSVGKGSFLLYITCSAYRSENEGMVEFMEANSGLRVLRQDVLRGYLEKADTMFAALFTSPA